jgi:hypothetical protein
MVMIKYGAARLGCKDIFESEYLFSKDDVARHKSLFPELGLFTRMPRLSLLNHRFEAHPYRQVRQQRFAIFNPDLRSRGVSHCFMIEVHRLLVYAAQISTTVFNFLPN